jgi:hypothetical protein
VDELSKPCGMHAKVHTCMDPFKDNPALVLNWRVLWRSLPACLRQEALIVNAKKSTGAGGQARMILDIGRASFTFLGYSVCRIALMKLSGIGSWSLTEARKKADSNQKSCLSRRELGNAILIQNTNKPKQYIDARNWLVHYADTHSDRSPISLECYLPAGRKAFYHAMYEHERKAAGKPSASLSVYLAAWRVECRWLVVMKSVCKFVKCNLCEYLKRQIDMTARTEVWILGILKDRLGQHYAFQSAQRLAQGLLMEKCIQSLGLKWFFKIDKMDQNSAIVPTVWSQLASGLFKEGDRIQVSLQGLNPLSPF